MSVNTNNKPATKGDINSLRTELKGDLHSSINSLRTELKGDLHSSINSLRTELKGDINSLRTELKGDLHSNINSLKTELKSDINSLRTELKSDIQQLDKTSKHHTLEMLKMQRDMRDMKEQMATKDDVSRIMTAIDVFAGEAKDYRNKDILRGHAVMKHDNLLKEHEKRISVLEQNK